MTSKSDGPTDRDYRDKSHTQPSSVRPSASEFLLCDNKDITCETYVFEPAPMEMKLGRLYATGQCTAEDGVGKELLDMTVQAMQKEYYRDPTRRALNSFELALHQANLVLHDATEQGVLGWMNDFHVAVGVLVGTELHITTAGDACIKLVRKGQVSLLSGELSYSPITDPLRTFSQVASGEVSVMDVLLFGTEFFDNLFRDEDVARFALDHSAQTITTRLEQLYHDQSSDQPTAGVVVSVLPEHVAKMTAKAAPLINDGLDHARQSSHPSLVPREPIVIHTSTLRAVLAITVRSLVMIWRWIARRVVPVAWMGLRQAGNWLVLSSTGARRGAHKFTKRGILKLQQRRSGAESQLKTTSVARHIDVKKILAWPVVAISNIPRWISRLPRTSKIFAIIAAGLAMVLLISLFMLQSKRADDQDIQRASEQLHDAETKVASADTALIYENREQAQKLLADAQKEIATINEQGLYMDETAQLNDEVNKLTDRLQKIVRSSTQETKVVGDFSNILEGKQPQSIVAVSSKIYSFNPETNIIVAMSPDGSTQTVTSSSEGIGFLQQAIVQAADKTVLFATDGPGLAILDTKDGTLTGQDISFASSNPDITSLATYGNRLYIYDAANKNIFNYAKTLSGFQGGGAWIKDNNFAADNIVSIAIDGSIYTLHNDGQVHELFKGDVVDFSLESVSPSLAGATKIITYDTFDSIYVFDAVNKRVIVFTKKGALIEQIYLDVAQKLKDVVITSDESTLYALDGSRVLAVPLQNEATTNN